VKEVRSASDGSSLHLYSPEHAVESPTAPFMMEQVTRTVSAEIVYGETCF